MLHGWNKTFLFPWEKKFFHMQNIFIVPAMQHGCRAKPLFSLRAAMYCLLNYLSYLISYEGINSKGHVEIEVTFH